MCNPSLARKGVLIDLNKSGVDVDQLTGRLGGDNYFFHVIRDSITQAFLFTEEAIAKQFLNALQFFPEFISAKLDSI